MFCWQENSINVISEAEAFISSSMFFSFHGIDVLVFVIVVVVGWSFCCFSFFSSTILFVVQLLVIMALDYFTSYFIQQHKYTHIFFSFQVKFLPFYSIHFEHTQCAKKFMLISPLALLFSHVKTTSENEPNDRRKRMKKKCKRKKTENKTLKIFLIVCKVLVQQVFRIFFRCLESNHKAFTIIFSLELSKRAIHKRKKIKKKKQKPKHFRPLTFPVLHIHTFFDECAIMAPAKSITLIFPLFFVSLDFVFVSLGHRRAMKNESISNTDH